jgi:hypothetical protein
MQSLTRYGLYVMCQRLIFAKNANVESVHSRHAIKFVLWYKAKLRGDDGTLNNTIGLKLLCQVSLLHNC